MKISLNMALRRWNKKLILVVAAYLIIQLLTFRTGIGSEDFSDIQTFKLANEGMVPYVDFFWAHGPLGLYIGAVFTKFFGSELITLRLTVILLGAIGIVIAYGLSKKIMSDGFALLAAFCGFSLFTFPCYSFVHYLSVITVIIALRYAANFFFDSKRYNLLMWGIFLTLTFFIRPVPAGAALIFSSLFTIVLVSLRHKNHFLKNIFYFSLPLIFANIISYIIWRDLFFNSIFINMTATGMLKDSFAFPHVINLTKNFLYSISMPAHIDIGLMYNIGTFVNALSGSIIYWFIFISPSVYFIVAIIINIIWEKWPHIRSEHYLLMMLCSSNFLLALYFCVAIAEQTYPDMDGMGKSWLLIGQYLLQPGIIAFVYLLSTVKRSKYLYTIFFTRAASCVLILSILLPKISDLRYSFMKMPIASMDGIRGIYLNRFYEKAVVPAIEYINRESNNLPEHILVLSSLPAFYVLTNKKPVFSEDTFGILTSNMYWVTGKKHFWFHELKHDIITEEDIDQFIIKRLIKTKPCVVSFHNDLLRYELKWNRFIQDNYRAVKKIIYKRIISTGSSSDNPSITIYLPNHTKEF